MSVIDSDILKAQISAGTATEWDFETAPAEILKCFLHAKNPDSSADILKALIAAGTAHEWDFSARTNDILKGFVHAATVHEWDFAAGPGEDVLQTFVAAKALFKSSFTARFDPAKIRLGAPRLELYPAGKTDAEILVIPINWYSKGADRLFSLDLWYGRYQEISPADDIRLSVFKFGASNPLGQEIIQNGYLSAKLSTQTPYAALTEGTELSLGSMWPHSKKQIDFKLNVPAGAASLGLVMVGLKMELLRSVVYGDEVFGDSIFGEFRQSKPENVLFKIHIKD